MYGAQQDPLEFLERLLGTVMEFPNELALKFAITGVRELRHRDGDANAAPISSHQEHTFCIGA